MKTNIQKYPAYKDSGVEWLGEIPSGWAEIKIKINSTIYNGDSLNENKKAKYESDDETHLAYISSKDIDLDTSIISYENGLRIPRNEPKYKVAKINSSLICIEGGSAGRKIAFTNQDVCFVNKLACVSAKNNLNSKFLYYTLKGSLFQTQFKLAMSGMIGGVAISSINNFYILIPPLPEQTAIAAFLDRKTTLIDQAIGIKQKQIELLKERRQILIHNAVTRGLNPNVKMKDSGVEYLGDIPKEWNVVRFKYIIRTKARLGWKGLKASEYVDNSDYGFLATPNIKGENIDYSGAYFITKKRYEESPEIMLKKDDILLVKDGSTLGIINIVKSMPFNCTVNSSIAVLRILDDNLLNAEYLNYFLKSDYSQKIIELKKDGMGVPHLFQSDINNFIALIPTFKEQKEILIHIEKQITKTSTAISLKEQEIEKLKEYKATLINSAVTGKIKVC